MGKQRKSSQPGMLKSALDGGNHKSIEEKPPTFKNKSRRKYQETKKTILTSDEPENWETMFTPQSQESIKLLFQRLHVKTLTSVSMAEMEAVGAYQRMTLKSGRKEKKEISASSSSSSSSTKTTATMTAANEPLPKKPQSVDIQSVSIVKENNNNNNNNNNDNKEKEEKERNNNSNGLLPLLQSEINNKKEEKVIKKTTTKTQKNPMAITVGGENDGGDNSDGDNESEETKIKRNRMTKAAKQSQLLCTLDLHLSILSLINLNQALACLADSDADSSGDDVQES